MNSIFIFILFIVGSIIFEAIKQGGKQNENSQKQPTMAQRPNKPAVQPTVAPHRSPGNQSVNSMQVNMVKPQKAAIPMEKVEILSAIDSEGMQTEGPIGEKILKSNKLEEEPSKEQGFMDIDINDLQRSIVMTEILGKPKALK